EIPRERMYAMQASTKLTGPNAYVTGFGSTKRVVVWDTAIQQFTTPELMLVFGHEMGHYVLGHVVRGFIIAMVFAFVLLFLTFRVASRVQRIHGQRWGIRGLCRLDLSPHVDLDRLADLFSGPTDSERGEPSHRTRCRYLWIGGHAWPSTRRPGGRCSRLPDSR